MTATQTRHRHSVFCDHLKDFLEDIRPVSPEECEQELDLLILYVACASAHTTLYRAFEETVLPHRDWFDKRDLRFIDKVQNLFPPGANLDIRDMWDGLCDSDRESIWLWFGVLLRDYE